MLDHVELVQQGDVGGGERRHEQFGVIGQKRVGLRRRSFRGFLLRQGLDDAHLKFDAALLDHLHGCGDGLDRAATQGMGRSFEQ